MSIPVPFADDPITARDRADYLRVRNETPVMSTFSEAKLRDALVTGKPDAIEAARRQGHERFDLEIAAIASMPTAEFKAFYKATIGSSRVEADRLLDAAVERHAEVQPSWPSGAAANMIEPMPAAEQITSDRTPATVKVRTALLEALGQASLSADRSDRERISNEREVVGRMSSDTLSKYRAALTRGPKAAKAVLDSAVERLRADVDGRDVVRAVPPLEERFNVSRRAMTRHYEFRDQPGKLAFTERPFSIRSTVDSPAAVKAMVDRATERGWETIRVSGSTEFRRQAWIAATARGVKAVGYEPTPVDRQTAERERERIVSQRAVAPARTSTAPVQSKSTDRTRTTVRERQVMTALEKAMRDSDVPAALRDQLRLRVASESARRKEHGQRVAVTVYDPAAPRPQPKVPEYAVHRSGLRERSR